MLNDKAKKLVAREARTQARQARDRLARGASPDVLSADAWQQALAAYPDFRDWPSARSYFDTIFYGEIHA